MRWPDANQCILMVEIKRNRQVRVELGRRVYSWAWVPAPAAVSAGAAATPAVCCGPPVSASGPPVDLCVAAAAWPRRSARRLGRSAATRAASLGATAAATGPSCRGLSSGGRTRTAASCWARGGQGVYWEGRLLTEVKYQRGRKVNLCLTD